MNLRIDSLFCPGEGLSYRAATPRMICEPVPYPFRHKRQIKYSFKAMHTINMHSLELRPSPVDGNLVPSCRRERMVLKQKEASVDLSEPNVSSVNLLTQTDRRHCNENNSSDLAH